MMNMTQNFKETLHELKNAALETIYDAIVNKGVGGQGYVWYTDTEGVDWVIELHHEYECRKNPFAMQCWKRHSLKNITDEPEKRLLKTAFSVNEIARMADQCTEKGIERYLAKLVVNGEVVKTKQYATAEEANKEFIQTVELSVGDKAEVVIEPVEAALISCIATKRYMREQKLRAGLM